MYFACSQAYQPCLYFFFFFNDTATTEIYTLSLHDALPISAAGTTTLDNYTQSSSGCTSVALVRGGKQLTCTLTNTLKAKQGLKVEKSCPNDAAGAGDLFNVVINDSPTSVNLACGDSHVFSDLSGTVTVTEAAAGTTTLDNYTQSRSGCTSVALVRGGTQLTCTITN